MVVSNIFYFHPYLGKWSNLTSIFFKRVGSTTNKYIISTSISTTTKFFKHMINNQKTSKHQPWTGRTRFSLYVRSAHVLCRLHSSWERRSASGGDFFRGALNQLNLVSFKQKMKTWMKIRQVALKKKWRRFDEISRSTDKSANMLRR